MAARIRCIRARCTCRKPLGKLQSLLEMMIADGTAAHIAIEKLDITLMCCRGNVLYPPTYPISFVDTGRFIDETGTIKKDLEFLQRNFIQDGPPVYLEDIPDFPSFE